MWAELCLWPGHLRFSPQVQYLRVTSFWSVQSQMALLFMIHVWSRETHASAQLSVEKAPLFALPQADSSSHTLSAFHFLTNCLFAPSNSKGKERRQGYEILHERLRIHLTCLEVRGNIPPPTHPTHWGGEVWMENATKQQQFLKISALSWLSYLKPFMSSSWVRDQGSQNCFSATSFVSCT